MAWNVFRWSGDISHCLSKIIITVAIHRNRSAEGVSWITQVLYTLVFLSRYTDIFEEHIAWNRILKWFYIISSIYIVFIMRFWFPRTREREIAWKMGGAILFGSLLLSPFTLLILPHKVHKTFSTWLWDFSEILESVCVLPQLLLLRQTTVPTVINSFYLVALGSYRALYVLNWIVRYASPTDKGPEIVSVIFGIIQTALYIDFGWVYWTRQRVKLRNGGIVDADDLRRGWLVSRVLGRHAEPVVLNDEESAPALGGERSDRSRNNKWGARGISVSADEGVLEGEHDDHEEGLVAGPVDPDARMQDPDELERALNESSSDEDSDDSDESDEDESDDSDESGNGKAKNKAPDGVDAGTSAWRS